MVVLPRPNASGQAVKLHLKSCSSSHKLSMKSLNSSERSRSFVASMRLLTNFRETRRINAPSFQSSSRLFALKRVKVDPNVKVVIQNNTI